MSWLMPPPARPFGLLPLIQFDQRVRRELLGVGLPSALPGADTLPCWLLLLLLC
jgi:hypothetical protein